MLTLRPPFDDDDRAELLRKIVTKDPMPPRRMDRGIPKDLETIVLKAISKEPRSRYAGAQALAADLRRFLDYQPVSARRASLPERFLRWHRRNPAVATLLCAVGILLVTLAAGAAFFALKLAREKETAMKNLGRALDAEREVRVRLGTAKLEEGRALRNGHQGGTRRRGLQALGEAAAIAPGIEVRNEIIGVLAQMDLEPLERVSVPGSELFLDSGHELGAVPDSDGSIRLYHADNFEEPIGTLPSTGSKVLAVELSPSAAYAAAKYDRADVPVSIFDVTREKEILRFPNPRGPFALSFHPCEERLCLGGNDGSIVEVALPGGDTIARFELGPGPRAIRYSPDGKRIAWIGAPGSTRAIQIIDMARHSVVARPFHRDAVLDADWSPDGKILATACSDYRAYLWDAGTFERIGTLEGHTAEVIRVAFSHDGLYLASASWDGRTILWQPDGGRELASAYGTFTRFRRRDGALGYRIADHKVGVWRIAGGEEYRALHAPVVEDKGPHECDVSSDGRWVAAACGAGGARVWSAERPRVSCAIRADFVVDVRFLADTSALLTSGSAGILRWPIRRDILPGEWILGPPRPLGIRGERFSVDDRARLVAVGQGHHAVVYHLEESRSMVARFGHPNLSRLQLSSSGRWLVTVTWHGSGVRVWDIEGAKLRKEFPCASARASFSPDERWLVIGTGASYSILDTLTWQERWSLSREGAGDLPGPIGFSGDSRLVALAHSRTHIDLHALATGQEIARLEPPRNLHGVTTAVLSRDGSCAAIGSEGETLHLWNLRLIRAHLANLGLDWEPRLGPPLAASRPDGVRLEHGPDRRWRNQASAERSERDDVIIEAFTALIAANPSPEAYRARAEALERRGLLHDALEDVEAAIALGPGDPSFEEWRGRLREECHGRRVERAEAEGMLSGDQPPRR
jgi:WD40 repeat protein